MLFDTTRLQSDDEFLTELNSNVWLMDNHKWALYVWEKFRLESAITKFSLVHADYHWDGIYDFFGMPVEEAKLFDANLEQLKEMIRTEDGMLARV